LRHRLAGLLCPQARIDAPATDQLVVVPHRETPVHHDQNRVVVGDRRQAVRHGDHGAADSDSTQCVVDLPLGGRVEGRGGLVQQEKPGVPQQGSRDGNPLALTAGQIRTALTHQGVPSTWQRGDETVDFRGGCGCLNLGIGGARPAECDVLAQGRIKEERVLEHDTQLLSPRTQRPRPQVDAVDQDGTLVGLVEPHQEA
jgi:hypothetical protein